MLSMSFCLFFLNPSVLWHQSFLRVCVTFYQISRGMKPLLLWGKYFYCGRSLQLTFLSKHEGHQNLVKNPVMQLFMWAKKSWEWNYGHGCIYSMSLLYTCTQAHTWCTEWCDWHTNICVNTVTQGRAYMCRNTHIHCRLSWRWRGKKLEAKSALGAQ